MRLTVEEALDEALEIARRILPGRAIAVLTGPEGGLRVSRGFGLSSTAERELELWAAAHPSLSERCIAQDGLVGVTDASGAGLTSLVAVPLVFRDARFGAIVALAQGGGGFGERELASFELLAARLTTGLLVCSLAAQATRSIETGMPGIRELHATLDRELDRRRRYGQTPTLALLEIEGWREIAATRGDDAAGTVAREAAEQIGNFCRISDFPFHLGDNRFALVLPEAAHEGACVLCARLRGAVEALPDRVTLICGLAVAGDHGESKEELLLRADQEVTRAHHSERERQTAHEKEEAAVYGRVSAGLSYYQQLGVERSASQEEIKAAFRQLARRYHPDQTNLENRELAERRFQEITRAYRVLSDPQRRAEYDGPVRPAQETPTTPGIDYYMALRVPRDAAQAQIVEAYRALAYQHRVAHRQGRRRSEERFKVVSEAYRVLANPETRLQYDRIARPPAKAKKGVGGLLRSDSSPDAIARDIRRTGEKVSGGSGECGRDDLERLARLAESARRLIPDEPLIGESLAKLESALGQGQLERAVAVRVLKDLETGFVT